MRINSINTQGICKINDYDVWGRSLGFIQHNRRNAQSHWMDMCKSMMEFEYDVIMKRFFAI